MIRLHQTLIFALLASALLAFGPTPPANAEGVDQAMRDSLTRFFANGIKHQGATAELAEVIRWPAASGSVNWRLPNFSRHPSRLSLIAEQQHGGQLRRWYVPVRLHWWTQAMVAKTDMPPRSLIHASQLMRKRIDIAGITGSWWQASAGLVGARTSRPVRSGQPLLSSYITRPSLLRNGDRITLISRIGGIRVTATGKILKNADAGDRVRVQNLRSKDVLQAIIIDGRSARVDAGGA
ncbi:MAG: flagellar basal body P-ring formation chaperone FlgA [Mariprofundaceae bacterium]|nr:flagellar basal body P-ring formation chaperone FlgA [Mariprofundaceae bacterium]